LAESFKVWGNFPQMSLDNTLHRHTAGSVGHALAAISHAAGARPIKFCDHHV